MAPDKNQAVIGYVGGKPVYGIAGGAPEKKEPKTEVPAEPKPLADFTDEELASTEAELLTEAEGLAESDEDVARLEAIADEVEAIRTEAETRFTAASERAARKAAAAERLAVPAAVEEEEADEEEDGKDGKDGKDGQDGKDGKDGKPEAVVEVEPEAIAASVRPRMPKAPAQHKTALVASTGDRHLTAVEGIGSFHAGDKVSLTEVGGMMAAKVRSLPRTSGTAGGGKEQFPIARFEYDYPDARIIPNEDAQWFMDSIGRQAVEQTTLQALTAAACLCAPCTPFYDLENLSSSARPVRACLVSSRWDRGCITHVPPVSFSSFAGAVTLFEADDCDVVTKDCLEIDCPEPETCTLHAVSACLTFNNMGARAFPEQVADATAKTAALQARFSERILLDAIFASSTATVTETQQLGALRDVFEVLDRVATSIRNCERMPCDAPMEVILPCWLKTAFRTDTLRQQVGDNSYTFSDALWDAMAASRNLILCWSLESRLATGEDAALCGGSYPSIVQMFVFPPGSHIHGEGGTLDLGIVRDSTLNSQNKFQIFTETFEGHCFRGLHSRVVNADICPDGKASAPEDVTICAGS